MAEGASLGCVAGLSCEDGGSTDDDDENRSPDSKGTGAVVIGECPTITSSRFKRSLKESNSIGLVVEDCVLSLMLQILRCSSRLEKRESIRAMPPIIGSRIVSLRARILFALSRYLILEAVGISNEGNVADNCWGTDADGCK